MQLLRIKLENWRGVESAEIQLDAGITIVEGDNEAGKTSFIEALNLLFRERDSTKKKELKRVAPKGVDAGSTVEVEFSSGDYHLTYSKTFNKKTATTLFVHKPVAMQLVGVEAHDRVVQILDETIDFSLWQAIQLEQGGEFSQISFKNSDSLARALDNAAGGTGAGEGESVLLAKAKSEYLKYFTDKAGKETGELATLREHGQTLEQSGEQIAGSLAELDSYIDDSARLSNELIALGERIPSMLVNVSGLERQYADFTTLKHHLNASQAQVKSCELRLNEVDRQITERLDLKIESDALSDALTDGDKAKQELQQLHKKASEAFEAATKERNELLKARQSAEANFQSVDAAIELRDQRLKLQQLELQQQQLQTSLRELTDLETELASYRVDDKAINRIEKMEQQRRDQEMQIGGQSAAIRLQFLKNTSVDDGSAVRHFNAGDVLNTDSSKSAALTLNKDLQIDITPAADNYEITLEYQKTVDSLKELLAEYGVKSSVEATSAHRKRASLAARLHEIKRSHKALLKDRSIDELTRSIETHRQSIAGLQSKATTLDDSSPDNSSALSNGPSDDMERLRQKSRQQMEELEHSINTARELRDQTQQKSADAKTKLDVCIESCEINKRSLEKLKKKMSALESALSTKKLETQRITAANEQAEAKKSFENAKHKIEHSNAAGLELRVDNARQSLQRAQEEVRVFELQQADVKARLDQMQSEGLHEKHQSVQAARSDNAIRLKQLDRRARAAEKLWKTLCHHQRQAQLSYARPLADRVATMGKVIFGDDFSVELSESLNIVSRTLNRVTVPFDDLSGGAREQLGILLRLAAAQLVSKTEAMPLILDDTLGHTDAKRLETMGAILSSAAQTAQIVVMTCYPARYSYVGSAKVVRLRQQQGSLFETTGFEATEY